MDGVPGDLARSRSLVLLPTGRRGRTVPRGVVQDRRDRRGPVLHGRAVEGGLLLIARPLPHGRRTRARQRLRVVVVVVGLMVVVVVRHWLWRRGRRLLLLLRGSRRLGRLHWAGSHRGSRRRRRWRSLSRHAGYHRGGGRGCDGGSRWQRRGRRRRRSG